MIARVFATGLASWLAAGAAVPLGAQGAPAATEPGASQLALANLPATDHATLKVSSPSFAAGGDIPFENTQYKGNVFPGLSWSAGPGGTKSYVIIMQDGDAMRNGAPIFHWSMVNIPPSITTLEPKMSQLPAGGWLIFGSSVVIDGGMLTMLQ